MKDLLQGSVRAIGEVTVHCEVARLRVPGVIVSIGNVRAVEMPLSESLDRASLARAVWNGVFRELDQRGCVADFAFIDKLQRTIKEATGVTPADEKLLEQADEMRR